MKTGQCECGQVRFEITGDIAPVTFCHCSQCRRTSGHLWGAATVAKSDFRITHDAGLKWYSSSDWAKRGFCGACGASLFYDMPARDVMSVAAGCIDAPTGLTPGRHIFVADKGDYYTIDDALPQLETF